MNISTKSEYGLRALIHIAGNSGREAVPAREISQRWHVPVKYLEQILKTLREARILESQVGMRGGYRLARPATLITAGEVIRVLDGRLSPIGCVSTYEPRIVPTCRAATSKNPSWRRSSPPAVSARAEAMAGTSPCAPASPG